jgi:hypothetical protein
MAYQSNLLGNLWTSYRQRRATPIAASEAQKSIAAGERAMRQRNIDRQFGMQERAYSDAASAAKMSGITDIAGMGLAYSLGSQRNKLLGGLLGAANPTSIPPGGMANLGGNTVPFLEKAKGFLGIGGEAGIGGTEEFIPGVTEGGFGALGTAGLAAGGGLLGSKTLQKLGVNKDISESLSYTAAGALAGSVIPGVGTLAGAAAGLGVSLLDDIGDFFGGLF